VVAGKTIFATRVSDISSRFCMSSLFMLVKPFLSMILLSGIILVGLSGCDTRFKPDAVLSQYVSDLNRSQLISISVPAILMPNGLPALRDRQTPLSTFDIGLLDFLSLQRCDVGIVAGRKNSILGKVMPDSQRFLYELDIIRAIVACYISDIELSKTLNLIAQKKRLELPIAFGNALFSGAESKVFFSLSNGFLPLDYSTADQQVLLSALSRLVSIGENLNTLPNVNGKAFEADLKALMDSEYAGRLLYTLAQISRYLATVSKAVSQLDSMACGASMVYFQRQFDVNYIQIIQPYMGRVTRSAYQVLPLLNRLAELSAPLRFDMSKFMNQFSLIELNSEWLRFQRASQSHARHWSELFALCSVPVKG
jgi:hypothetical protein